MVAALNEKFTMKKPPNTKSTLIYMGECPLTGVLYLHKWAKGEQELIFNNHTDAKQWTSENNCKYILG